MEGHEALCQALSTFNPPATCSRPHRCSEGLGHHVMAQWGSGEMSRRCHRCFDVRLSFLSLGAGLAMEDRRTRAALPTWWGHSTSADYAERVWTAEESNDPVLGIFLLYSTLCIIPSQREWWHLVSLLYASLRFLGISLYTLPLEQWFQALSWEEAHQGRGSWQAVRLYRAERPRYPAPSTPLDRPRSWCQIRREIIFFLPSLRALLDHGVYLARSFRYWGPVDVPARLGCSTIRAAMCLLQDGIAVLEGAEVVVRGIAEEEDDVEEEGGPP